MLGFQRPGEGWRQRDTASSCYINLQYVAKDMKEVTLGIYLGTLCTYMYIVGTCNSCIQAQVEAHLKMYSLQGCSTDEVLGEY